MAAATGVSYHDRPARLITGEATVDLASIAGAANEDSTIAVPEANVGDIVLVSPQATLLDGLVISQAYVSAAGTITFTTENHTAGALNQGATVFSFALIAGRLSGGAG